MPSSPQTAEQSRLPAPRPGGTVHKGFEPEFRFLLDALRSARGSGTPLDRGAAARLDWETIVPGLRRHGILWLATPLLAQDGLVPADAAVRLRQLMGEQALESLRRIDETVRVARAFDARGIRYLVVKGVPLSVQLHGNPARRAARDIDILVEPGAAGAACAALEELGYVLPSGAPPAHDGPIEKEIGYVHATDRTLVEVHDRLTENFDLLPWEFEPLWAEREIVPVGGVGIPTMARQRLALYLCVHGAKHCWGRLIWLDDLAAVLDSPAAIETALADAEAAGLGAAMLHAFAVLHNWFGKSIPDPILERARASRNVRFLNRLVARFHADPHWYEPPARYSWRRFRQGSIQSRLFAYAMKRERGYWRSQLSLELSSPADRALFHLPANMGWLYPALRPVGWLVRRWRGVRG